MNELTRSAYLSAMGIDIHVSRRQLPGAAVSRRIAILRQSRVKVPAAVASAGHNEAVKLARSLDETQSVTAAGAGAVESPKRVSVKGGTSTQFSLLAVNCGDWLWIEELVDPAQSAAQLSLIQSVSFALGLVVPGADKSATHTQFDWPIHNNQQLDQGLEAARSSVTGFLQRNLEQNQCRGLVVLGDAANDRVAWQHLDCSRVLRTLATAQMMQDPTLKQTVWRDLRPHFLSA